MNTQNPPEGYTPCVECDGLGYVKCKHQDRDGYKCPACGKNLLSDMMEEAEHKLEGER